MSGRHPFSELTADFGPERRKRIDAMKRDLLAEMPLHELRRARELTQKDVAHTLNVNQPAVAKLERRADVYVSSLRSYIEAVGGRLKIVAEFPEGEVAITNFANAGDADPLPLAGVNGLRIDEEFRDFLRDEVNINPSRLDRLQTSVGAVSGYLKDNMKGYQKSEPQGSLALETIIGPVDDNDEYDADIQVVMNPNSEWQPRDYIKAVYDTLRENKTYADKLMLKTRCVTIDYAGDFHLDVVPRITVDGRHYILNRVDNMMERTDGNGYRDWFNEKNRIAGGNLKRVVRLLKYLRDHKNNYTAKSILLTTLTGMMISESDEGTKEVSTVPDTLATILTRMDAFLQEHQAMPDIKNPALPSETFNRYWDQVKYANFRDKMHSYALSARKANAEAERENAVRVWQQIFEDSFGMGTPPSASGNRGNSPSRPLDHIAIPAFQ